jgi:hypothetical protein
MEYADREWSRLVIASFRRGPHRRPAGGIRMNGSTPLAHRAAINVGRRCRRQRFESAHVPSRGLMAFALLSSSLSAEASCKRPAPAALPFDKGSIRGSCPFSYSATGSLCTPSGSSARFVLIKPSSGSNCPSNCSSSGSLFVTESNYCCAFVSASASHPIGYAKSRPWCLAS